MTFRKSQWCIEPHNWAAYLFGLARGWKWTEGYPKCEVIFLLRT